MMNDLIGNNILIVTSNSTEKDEVESALKEKGVKLKKILQSLTSRLKVGILDGYPVVVLCADRGSFKDESVGVLLPSILPFLKPKLAILSGFSYGRRDSILLHDVAVSRDVVSLVDFRADDQGIAFRSFPRIASLIGSEELDSLVAMASANLATLFKKLGLKSALKVGSALSGEIMAESHSFFESIFVKFPDSLSGDMEARPFATHCAAQGIPWLIAKSPSDFGDGTGGTTNGQAYSAKMSAFSAIELINAYARLKKLACPQTILSSLDALPGEPLECLVMPTQAGLFANSDYPAAIRKFVSLLSLPELYDRDFQAHLVGLVKEISENAAKHERSDTVYLRGSVNQMIVEYDGKPFDIVEKFRAIRDGGGGKGEYDEFNRIYATENPIVKIDWEYVGGKNQVIFTFLGAVSDLRKNFFCSLYLDVVEIRAYAYSVQSYSELSECETVWLNVEDSVVSLSDWYLLLQSVMRIPKTVNVIKIRGCPARLVAAFRQRLLALDQRLDFI